MPVPNGVGLRVWAVQSSLHGKVCSRYGSSQYHDDQELEDEYSAIGAGGPNYSNSLCMLGESVREYYSKLDYE